MNVKKNLANYISMGRIVLTPVLAILGIVSTTSNFISFALFLYVTDIVDGYLARKYSGVSKLGRTLDTIGDYVFYSTFSVISLVLIRNDIPVNSLYLVVPILFFIVPKIIGYYYLKTFPHIHLRSWQLTSYPLIAFFVVSLLFDFSFILLLIVNILSLIGFIEETSILLLCKSKTNQEVNSLMEVLRERKLKTTPHDTQSKNIRT